MTEIVSALAAQPVSTVTFDAHWLRFEMTRRAERIWASLLGRPLHILMPRSCVQPPSGRRWTACVTFAAGGSTHALALNAGDAFLRQAAAALRGTAPTHATRTDILLAVSELAQLLAAEAADALGVSTVLGVPLIVAGARFATTLPQSLPLAELHAVTGAHTLTISIVGAAPRASARLIA